MSARLRPLRSSSIGLIQFPGSNCDQDVVDALKRHFGVATTLVWHTETFLPSVDALILPGGFSFGDYLRSGTLAAHSPVMEAVKRFAKAGGPILGICNGFQVLTESGLLPGALLRNSSRRFVCRAVHLAVGSGSSVYQSMLKGQVLRIPIAHGEGRFYIDPEGLRKLEQDGRVAFRYAEANGSVSVHSNPNGSVGSIAGVVSENGRICGLMPHPERATEKIVGGSPDGLGILEAFLASVL